MEAASERHLQEVRCVSYIMHDVLRSHSSRWWWVCGGGDRSDCCWRSDNVKVRSYFQKWSHYNKLLE